MAESQKGYKGLGMEGAIATWYARNTARDTKRFALVAGDVVHRTSANAHVLEVAPGPGYLAIELAKSGRVVTGLDISHTFVRIARENAAKAGVLVDFRHGNASQMPFENASFEYVICIAAFKSFSDPVGALNEMHRVLKPDGQASINDLRKDASRQEIETEVRGLQLSPWSAAITRWIFRHMLLKRAYTRSALEAMAAQSKFSVSEIVNDGIGFDLRLTKRS